MEDEIIQPQKRKGGRPFGSIIATAVCHNPELKKQQKKDNNEKFKETTGYIKYKLKRLAKQYHLELDLNDEMTMDELNSKLNQIKSNNLTNRANKLKELV